MVDLSVVIVNYNTNQLANDCVDSVFQNTRGTNYEVIVVDNHSKEKLQISKRPNLRVIFSQKNLGFAGANNLGTERAKGRYLLYLNSDTLIEGNALGEMVDWMDKHPKVGVVSCALKNKDGSLQGTGGHFPTLLRVFSWMTIQDVPGVDLLIKPFHPLKEKSFSSAARFYEKRRKLDWVTGAFMFCRREALEAVGGWDEEYFMYTEEVDLQYRIKKAGWQVWYLPRWSIVHLGGASSTAEFPILSEYEGIKRFYRKFYPKWQYPILRSLLKVGALGRMVLFGILEGRDAYQTYYQAFKKA